MTTDKKTQKYISYHITAVSIGVIIAVTLFKAGVVPKFTINAENIKAAALFSKKMAMPLIPICLAIGSTSYYFFGNRELAKVMLFSAILFFVGCII